MRGKGAVVLSGMIPQIARALVELCETHGPQSFHCWEVSEHGGGQSNMRIGRAARQNLAALKQQLLMSPYRLVEYSGRFHMERA